MQWSEIDVRIRAQTGHRLGNRGNKVLDQRFGTGMFGGKSKESCVLSTHVDEEGKCMKGNTNTTEK